MSNKILITDFKFLPSGYGQYKVKYISPVTGKIWFARVNDMQLIDLTKNSDNPKQKDLKKLKEKIKYY
jgi:hypothetical protein